MPAQQTVRNELAVGHGHGVTSRLANTHKASRNPLTHLFCLRAAAAISSSSNKQQQQQQQQREQHAQQAAAEGNAESCRGGAEGEQACQTWRRFKAGDV